MPTYRCPVLVWKNSAGFYTASLVEQYDRAAVASNPREALDQLRGMLDWQYREEPWRDPPDLKDPALEVIKISVRPEYQDELNGRRYPLQSLVDLRVWCVIGRQGGGPRFASLPMIGLRLNLSEHDDAKLMVHQMVQRWFEGLTPRALSRYMPPDEVFLDDVFVSIDLGRSTAKPRIMTERLERVADPLGDSKVRSLYGRAWERDREVADLVTRMQAEKGSWLIVGDHGSGKTTVLCEVVRHLERHLNDEEKQAEDTWILKPVRRFWQTSAGRLISGMKYLGQWEERLESVIRDLGEIDGILCIESLLEMVRTGGREATDSLAAFCIPYLQRGELRIVAEVSPTELDAIRRLLPGLTDLFQMFTLSPLDSAKAVRLLDRVAENNPTGTKLTVSRDSSAQTVRLFHRFQPYHALPGEVVAFWRDLLDRTARSSTRALTKEAVVQTFVNRTGLPERFLRDDKPLSREDLVGEFTSQIVGQPSACETAADVVIRFKAGMNDPRRPLGVLLFCGPTGVGKTELARAVSRCLFGGRLEGATVETSGGQLQESSAHMIRLDMSEYSGPWAADRLLMQSNGEPSDFLQQIRRQPFTVLLLDEVEKAHPSVYDVLMNVFDEGRLTDRFGRTTWFRSTVILLTSNLGSDSTGQVGFSESGAAPTLRHEAAVREFFRPEFFNRLDRVVTFEPLNREVIIEITEKELREIAGREGLRKIGLKLSWSREVVEHLSVAGFDPRYGARPLQRTLETQVVAPLARFLAESDVSRDKSILLRLSTDRTIEFEVV